MVLELGCGSGALTRHLVAAGHRVIAADASPANAGTRARDGAGVEAFRRLALPDDQPPVVDAIVSAGHVLSDLPNAPAVERAFRSVAAALRLGGVLAVDLLDRTYRPARAGKAPVAMVRGDWAVFIDVDSAGSGDPRPRHHDVRAQCVRRVAARRRVMSMPSSTRRMWCVCLPTNG